MAMSGSFTGTVGSSSGITAGHKLSGTWSATHTSSATKITITIKTTPVSGVTYGTFSGTLKLGTVNSTSVSKSVPASSGVTLVTHTFTVDGTGAKTLTLSLTGSISDTSGWTSTNLSTTVKTDSALPDLPGVPTGISSSVSGTSIKISFTKGARATSTRIQRSVNGGAYSTRTTITGSSWTDTGLTRGSKYKYRLTSINARGSSGNTHTSERLIPVLPPAAPSNFSTERVSATSIKLSWTKGARAETTRIRWKRNTGEFSDHSSVTGSSVTISGLKENSEYNFNIRSVNASGTSDHLSSMAFFTTLPKPSVPAFYSATRLKGTQPSTRVREVQIKRTSTGGTQIAASSAYIASTGVLLSPAPSLTDTYSVRFYAGPGPSDTTYPNAASGIWSPWSDVSLSRGASTRTPPKLVYTKAERWNASTNAADDEGTRISVVTSAVIDRIGTENKGYLEVGIRVAGSSAAFTTQMVKNGITSGLTWNNQRVLLTPTAVTTNAYEVRFRLWDTVGAAKPVVKTLIVPAVQVALTVGDTGIGVGKNHIAGRGLDVSGSLHLAGNFIQSSGYFKPANPGFMRIGGKEYQMYGNIPVSDIDITTASGPLFRSTAIPIQLPSAPPSGWRYALFAYAGSGNAYWAHMYDGTLTDRIRVMFYSTVSRTLKSGHISWALIQNT